MTNGGTHRNRAAAKSQKKVKKIADLTLFLISMRFTQAQRANICNLPVMELIGSQMLIRPNLNRQIQLVAVNVPKNDARLRSESHRPDTRRLRKCIGSLRREVTLSIERDNALNVALRRSQSRSEPTRADRELGARERPKYRSSVVVAPLAASTRPIRPSSMSRIFSPGFPARLRLWHTW